MNFRHLLGCDTMDDIRFLFILLVGYSGFMTIDEIISVRVMDIQFHSDHMTILVPKRKNDQHRKVIQLMLRCLAQYRYPKSC